MRRFRLFGPLLAIFATVLAGPVNAQPRPGFKPGLQYIGVVTPSSSFSLPAIRISSPWYVGSTKLGTTDTPYGFTALIIRAPFGADMDAPQSLSGMIIKDLMTSPVFSGCSVCGSESVPGQNWTNDAVGGPYRGSPRFNYSDASPGNGHTLDWVDPTNGYYQVIGNQYVLIITAFDFSNPANLKFYESITPIGQSGSPSRRAATLSGTYTAPTGSFSPNIYNNVNGYTLNGNSGNNNVPGEADYALLIMDSSATLAGFLDSSGNLSSTVLNAIYNSGLQNIGTNCASVLGYQPQVCHYADNTGVSSFLTERGTSTATWSLQPSVSNTAGTITAIQSGGTGYISSSPSGPSPTPPTVPYRKWNAAASSYGGQADPSTGTAVTGTSTSIFISSQANAIAAGDLLFVSCVIADNSNLVPRAMVLPIAGVTAPAGFTIHPIVDGTTNASGAWTYVPADTFYESGISFWTVSPNNYPAPAVPGATPGDVTFTINYTALTNPHGADCAMIDYGNATTVSSAAYKQNAGPTWPGTALTPTAANSVYLNLTYEWQSISSNVLTMPGSGNVFHQYPNNYSGTPAQIIQEDELVTGTSSIGPRTITSGVSPNRSANVLSLIIQ